MDTASPISATTLESSDDDNDGSATSRSPSLPPSLPPSQPPSLLPSLPPSMPPSDDEGDDEQPDGLQQMLDAVNAQDVADAQTRKAASTLTDTKLWAGAAAAGWTARRASRLARGRLPSGSYDWLYTAPSGYRFSSVVKARRYAGRREPPPPELEQAAKQAAKQVAKQAAKQVAKQVAENVATTAAEYLVAGMLRSAEGFDTFHQAVSHDVDISIVAAAYGEPCIVGAGA